MSIQRYLLKKLNYKMPPASIRKAKRVTVLTKRTQCLRKYYRERSHKPCKCLNLLSTICVIFHLADYYFTNIIFFLVYDKLKNNNSYLAKALTHEKQNNQSLFSQNLALIAELQNLNLACNKQNVSIIYINKQIAR